MECMGEEWRPIEDFPEYQISSLGRIKSFKKNRERILRPRISWDYYTIQLTNDLGHITKFIHCLLAIAFIPNPQNKPEVDHINRNQLDNRLENLRWATRQEQLLNRNNFFRGTNTGEPYISYDKYGNRFAFAKTSNGILTKKFFKTLEEAIQYRDNLLA